MWGEVVPKEEQQLHAALVKAVMAQIPAFSAKDLGIIAWSVAKLELCVLRLGAPMFRGNKERGTLVLQDSSGPVGSVGASFGWRGGCSMGTAEWQRSCQPGLGNSQDGGALAQSEC